MTISNNPPPLDMWTVHIEDLFHEAQGFLDGEKIETQGQADAVGKLLDALRTAKRDADLARAAEKKPHDDAAKAVQTAWKPLIDKCDLAANVAKKALTPWLEKLADEQRAEAARLAEEAEIASLAAMEAHRAASTDLSAASAARDLDKAATGALKAAARAEKAKPQATGGARAIGLRGVWRAEVTDFKALLRHYLDRRPEEMKAWLAEQADKDVRAGERNIPGVNAIEEKVAA